MFAQALAAQPSAPNPSYPTPSIVEPSVVDPSAVDPSVAEPYVPEVGPCGSLTLLCYESFVSFCASSAHVQKYFF